MNSSTREASLSTLPSRHIRLSKRAEMEVQHIIRKVKARKARPEMGNRRKTKIVQMKMMMKKKVKKGERSRKKTICKTSMRRKDSSITASR